MLKQICFLTGHLCERGTSSLNVCVLRPSPTSIPFVPLPGGEQAWPVLCHWCKSPSCFQQAWVCHYALFPVELNAVQVSKAQSLKSPCQGLNRRVWPSWHTPERSLAFRAVTTWTQLAGKESLEIAALETSMGKWISGLEKDYHGLDPGKTSQVKPDLSHWKLLYHVGMT